MPQHYRPDKENLDLELEKMDTNLYQMVEQGLMHEHMIMIIDSLVSDWCKENLSTFINTYQNFEKEFEELSDDDKKYYADIDEFIQEKGNRWWIETFYHATNEEKETLLHRYNLTISCCLHSTTYDYQTIQETIEHYWNN
jgi:hypothetical protein